MKLGVDAAVLDGRLVTGDVEVVDGCVAALGRPPAGTGLVAAPGFVDLQVNGFAGIDLLATDDDGIRHVAAALLATGVTAWQPTLITSDPGVTTRAADRIVAASPGIGVGRGHHGRDPGDGAYALGIHLEGPFLAPARLGTHPEAHRRDPDPALLDTLLAPGHVSSVTLAPETPGALELIDRLRERGVVVSLGHSNATAAQAHAAFERGARTVTHVFNAMRRFTPRDPGIAGVALTRPEVQIQAIVDGVHLAADTVRLIWAAARGRVALVTDAIAAAGLGDGRCWLGEVEVTVTGGVARRDEGTLAGSVLSMPVAVRNLMALGVPLADAVDAATTVPAAIVDRHDLGRMQPGAIADLVILDEEAHVHRVLRAGVTTEVTA